MEQTVGRGMCPFCPPDPEKNKEILRGAHWVGWPNPFPYQNHQHHFVLATRQHIDYLADLTADMWVELLQHIKQLERVYDLDGGSIVMRFGSEPYNAGTIRHLHVHLQVPNEQGPAFAVFGKIKPTGDVIAQIKLLIDAFTPRK